MGLKSGLYVEMDSGKTRRHQSALKNQEEEAAATADRKEMSEGSVTSLRTFLTRQPSYS